MTNAGAGTGGVEHIRRPQMAEKPEISQSNRLGSTPRGPLPIG